MNYLGRRVGFGILATSVLTVMQMSFAHAAQYETSYTVSYAGLPVARSSFKTNMSGNNYSISGWMKSSGLGAIVSSTTGTATISGSMGSVAAVPSNYQINYEYGKKAKATTIAFSNGTATQTVNNPPPKVRADRVPVTPSHLTNVADPLSLTLIVANSKGEVCNRTLRLYDGEVRANLVLSYKSTRPFSTNGFKGDQIICAAKIEPISGYRKGHKSVEYLKQGKPVEIGFAQLEGSNIFAPVTARIKTQIGHVTVRATKLKKTGG